VSPNTITTKNTKKIADSIIDLVGGTPLVYLTRIADGCGGKIALKLEGMEPANSVKDRIGRNMIEDAEKKGVITSGKTTLVSLLLATLALA